MKKNKVAKTVALLASVIVLGTGANLDVFAKSWKPFVFSTGEVKYTLNTDKSNGKATAQTKVISKVSGKKSAVETTMICYNSSGSVLRSKTKNDSDRTSICYTDTQTSKIYTHHYMLLTNEDGKTKENIYEYSGKIGKSY